MFALSIYSLAIWQFGNPHLGVYTSTPPPSSLPPPPNSSSICRSANGNVYV